MSPHRLNGWGPDHTDPEWAERVEAEAARQTDSRQANYERAQRRLARAEERLILARANAPHRADRPTRAIRQAEVIVTQRRAELLALQALMQASPASAAHRGVGSYRPVPPGRTL